MPNPIVTSPKNSEIKVITTPKTTLQIKTSGGGGGSGVNRLAQLIDVNVTGANDGEVLVYDAATEKYVIKAIPEIDGGEF